MAYFAATYDLIEKDEDQYQDLWDELKRLQAHHYQESCWFVDRDCTTKPLRDLLESHIEDDDMLMVIRFSTRPRWTKAKLGTKAWVDARFP